MRCVATSHAPRVCSSFRFLPAGALGSRASPRLGMTGAATWFTCARAPIATKLRSSPRTNSGRIENHESRQSVHVPSRGLLWGVKANRLVLARRLHRRTTPARRRATADQCFARPPGCRPRDRFGDNGITVASQAWIDARRRPERQIVGVQTFVKTIAPAEPNPTDHDHPPNSRISPDLRAVHIANPYHPNGPSPAHNPKVAALLGDWAMHLPPELDAARHAAEGRGQTAIAAGCDGHPAALFIVSALSSRHPLKRSRD